MTRALLAALIVMLAPVGAAAERLAGPEIRSLFTGNTIAGTYVGGRSFSEYHAADGRALGDNGYGLNVDACWNTDGDKVCYHYGPQKDRRTYCFTVDRIGGALWLRMADRGDLNAIAEMVPGNPENHGDGGNRWSCDDLLSRAPNRSPAARPASTAP
jgi:hypothetical protein